MASLERPKSTHSPGGKPKRARPTGYSDCIGCTGAPQALNKTKLVATVIATVVVRSIIFFIIIIFFVCFIGFIVMFFG
jgi:hypothetical protein